MFPHSAVSCSRRQPRTHSCSYTPTVITGSQPGIRRASEPSSDSSSGCVSSRPALSCLTLEQLADRSFVSGSPCVAGESSLAHGLKFDGFTAGPAPGEVDVLQVLHQPVLVDPFGEPRVLELTFARHGASGASWTATSQPAATSYLGASWCV